MVKSNEVLEEVESVTSSYIELAESASKIFFAILGLGSVHYLYQYSLNFYMNLVYKVLKEDSALSQEKDLEKRKQLIEDSLYKLTYIKVASSVLSKDVIILGMRFLQLKVKAPLISLLLKETLSASHSLPPLLKGSLSDRQLRTLQAVIDQPAFKGLISSLQNQQALWK